MRRGRSATRVNNTTYQDPDALREMMSRVPPTTCDYASSMLGHTAMSYRIHATTQQTIAAVLHTTNDDNVAAH